VYANPLPFLFLPGALLIGYLVGGWHGVDWAAGVWAIPVAIGTFLQLFRICLMAIASKTTTARADVRDALLRRPPTTRA
jgi:hypothetical protein